MLHYPLALLLLVNTACGSVIDTALRLAPQIIDNISANPPNRAALQIEESYFDTKTGRVRKLCTVKALGSGQHDDKHLLAAFQYCGSGGIIRLPDANYTIGSPLQVAMRDAELDVHGWISFSTDIEHWIEHRVPLDFQNLALAWVISGANFIINGNNKGGIDGNGETWYNWAKDEGNKYGRPMSLALVDSTNASVIGWSIVQPQFWAAIIVNSTNVLFRDYYVNATSHNPESAAHRVNWLQNTDGIDTYRSHNVTIENMIYQGGDDCVAFKPNSSMITVRNVTCYGGTGVAFGSIAQYQGQLDYLEDIVIDDMQLLPSSQHLMKNGLYLKSWMGYPIGLPPNGGGGGHGYAKNMHISNLYIENNLRPIFLQTDLIYLPEHRGEGRNTGLFEWSDITFINVTGTSARNRVIWLDCSSTTPCRNLTFDNVDLRPSQKDDSEIHYVCNNVIMDGNSGLDQCHPSYSSHESWNEDQK